MQPAAQHRQSLDSIDSIPRGRDPDLIYVKTALKRSAHGRDSLLAGTSSIESLPAERPDLVGALV